MIAIIDYDAGNIKSVQKALEHLGQEAALTRDAEIILSADHVVLPGVGNFGDAMEKLEKYKLIPVIKKVVEEKIPFLGICLGMQVLFESSEESPGTPGLGILKGKIVRFDDREGFKIPHMGWNSLHKQHFGRLYVDMPESPYVYFVHSYYLKAEDDHIVKATADYANLVHASVEEGNVFGCQFHPEKSSEIGLRILRNFISIKKGDC